MNKPQKPLRYYLKPKPRRSWRENEERNRELAALHAGTEVEPTKIFPTMADGATVYKPFPKLRRWNNPKFFQG